MAKSLSRPNGPNDQVIKWHKESNGQITKWKNGPNCQIVSCPNGQMVNGKNDKRAKFSNGLTPNGEKRHK